MEDGAADATEPAEITRLDDRTVREIAAGEVVERPASVVKELVENALDAGADRVAVAVENGGLDGIRVRDDGHGMHPDQLPRAVAEHTTSKLGGMEELDDGIGTLGFRGEALYTVGAVARLTVRSRPPERDTGAELVVDHGDRGDVEPVGCPVGTTVEVRELFAETPARRKFLKTPATEFDRVNGIVSAYALANPDVAVSLEHDDREVFASPGDRNLRSAVLAVYGREVAEAMIDVTATGTVKTVGGGDSGGDGGGDGDSDSGDDDGDSGGDGDGDAETVSVRGVVSDPETTRASREYVTTFVNGRWVRDSDLRSAVVDAYGGQLAADRYPFAVLFVKVPPESVDANVHPRKTEVRFDDDASVFETVRTAVRDGLLDAGLLRTSAPRGRSAPEETTLDPEVVGGSGRDDGRSARAEESARAEQSARAEETVHSEQSDEEADHRGDGRASAETGPSGDQSSEPAGEDGDVREPETVEQADTPKQADTPEQVDTPEQADAPEKTNAEGQTDATESEPEQKQASTTDSVLDAWDDSAATGQEDTPETGHATGDTSGAAKSPSPRGWQQSEETRREEGEGESETESGSQSQTESGSQSQTESDDGGAGSSSLGVPAQRTLAGGTTDDWTEYDTLPRLRVLGQYDDTYLVCETESGLVLVDQHAADERVNYERLREAVGRAGSGEAAMQALAEPVAVPLTAREAALFDAFEDALAAAGFQAKRREGTTDDDGETAGSGDTRAVVVTAVPAVFDAALDPKLLRDTLVSFAEDVAGSERPAAEAADELLADLACYPSITGNTSLTEGSVTALLEALDECENPYACPHGRPVVVRFDATEIEDRFERDYPGHGGRRD
jgi:DNA mismatch repair protein MutL